MTTSDNPKVRWALIGAGRAGSARARAIHADDRSKLVAVYRGRHAEQLGAPVATSLEAAMAEADAVAVCSPSEAHPEQVLAALEARKHVVCEYPLAPTGEIAKGLFDRAAQLDQILHVEHIELLHAPQRVLRSHTRHDTVTKLRQESFLQGPADIPASELIRKSLSRLHRVLDLCGALERVEAVEASPGMVKITSHHANGALVRMVWQQSPYVQRMTRMRCRTVSGVDWQLDGDALYQGRAPQTLIESKGLFAQDHEHAMSRILSGTSPYVSNERILAALQTLDTLENAT